jgi:lipoate-protein ligase A
MREIRTEFNISMEIGNLSENELKIAGELADKKYTNDGWNLLHGN